METPETSGEKPRVAIFGPHPMLSVTLEARGEGRDDIHLHAAGQGVWVTRMAAELGAHPILCGLIGGETGTVLRGLLERLPGERRLAASDTSSGCYVMDRRGGMRDLVASRLSEPPSRHELDDLFSITCAAALESSVLVVCNPYPAETLPLNVYGDLVSDARSNGVPVIVDLSSPRLDHALEGGPDLVKLNDWELAQFVVGPVDTPEQRAAAVARLRERGASDVLLTRGGQSAFVYRGDDVLELIPPHFERGHREGCGDSMTGALAAAWARGLDADDSLVLAAAAGAANFLRQGLGSGARPIVEELVERVELRLA
jgi:1-phosphofructokinase